MILGHLKKKEKQILNKFGGILLFYLIRKKVSKDNFLQ